MLTQVRYVNAISLGIDGNISGAIPDAPYTFGVPADAQAVGDLQALRASEFRAVRVDLGSHLEVGIGRMADEVAWMRKLSLVRFSGAGIIGTNF